MTAFKVSSWLSTIALLFSFKNNGVLYGEPRSHFAPYRSRGDQVPPWSLATVNRHNNAAGTDNPSRGTGADESRRVGYRFFERFGAFEACHEDCTP